MAQGYNMALLDKASVFKCLHKSKDQKEQKLLLFFSYSFIIATGIYSPEKIISVKIDRIDLLAVQRTLRSLLQHHSWKASILWHSAFFKVQLSQFYVTTGKTIPLTTQIFVGRIMPLLFNTLSRFVRAFLPRSDHLLISWLQSPSVVMSEPKKRKSVTIFTFFSLFE